MLPQGNLLPYFIAPGVALILLDLYLSYKKGRLSANWNWKDTATSASIGAVALLITVLTKKVYALALMMLVFELSTDLHFALYGAPDLGVAWWVMVIAFIGDDFSFYWHHRFSHTIRILWAAHVVHHSSTYYNLGTSFRNGWFIFLYKPVFWLWLPLIGVHPLFVLFTMSISSLYQFLLHSTQVPHLGPLEWFMNTPQHHQLHHSCNVRYLDCNHGGIFLVWDRIFGTFLDSRKVDEPRKFGVLKGPCSHNPKDVVFHEISSIWQDVRTAPTWRARMMYIFGPPGWSHDGSRQTARQLKAQLQNASLATA